MGRKGCCHREGISPCSPGCSATLPVTGMWGCYMQLVASGFTRAHLNCWPLVWPRVLLLGWTGVATGLWVEVLQLVWKPQSGTHAWGPILSSCPCNLAFPQSQLGCMERWLTQPSVHMPVVDVVRSFPLLGTPGIISPLQLQCTP